MVKNPNDAEKARKLTEAEQRRMARFEALAQKMTEQGYQRVDLTVGLVGANVFGILLLIPLLVVGLGLFFLRSPQNPTFFDPKNGLLGLLIFFAVFFILIIVHELIHGLSWAIFSENHWKDISFGFIKEYLTPYCACCVPLKKGQYIFGALMPLVVLGILPMIAGIALGSMPVLLMGIIMADAAAGDILIVWRILRYPSKGKEIVYIDHPTQAGGVIFEKPESSLPQEGV